MADSADPAQREQSPIGSLEAPVIGLVAAIPAKALKTWAQAFFRPVDTYNEGKGDPAANNALKQFAMAGLFSGMVAIIALLPFVFLGTVGATMHPSLAFLPWFVALPAILVLAPVSAIISGYVGSAVYFILAKIFGGNGSYKDQTFAYSLLYGSNALFEAPFVLLSLIPIVGFVFSLANLAINIYIWLYNNYKVMRSVHALSQGKAAAVVLIPPIVAAMLLVVATVFLGLMFFGLKGLPSMADGMS